MKPDPDSAEPDGGSDDETGTDETDPGAEPGADAGAEPGSEADAEPDDEAGAELEAAGAELAATLGAAESAAELVDAAADELLVDELVDEPEVAVEPELLQAANNRATPASAPTAEARAVPMRFRTTMIISSGRHSGAVCSASEMSTCSTYAGHGANGSMRD